MQIPIARPVIGQDEVAAVSDVLMSGMLAQGEKVAEFEQKFAGYAAAPMPWRSITGLLRSMRRCLRQGSVLETR